MENDLFSFYQAVRDNPENGPETEKFTRELAIQSLWVESQQLEDNNGQVELVFRQNEDGKELALFVYTRNDGSNEPPTEVVENMISGELEYTEFPGAFFLTLAEEVNYTLVIVAEDDETILLSSNALKNLLTYLKILYGQDSEDNDEEAGNSVAYSAGIRTMHGSDIVAKPKSGAGKVIGMLIAAAVIVAVVYFTQS